MSEGISTLTTEIVRSELESLIERASKEGKISLSESLKTVLRTFENEAAKSGHDATRSGITNMRRDVYLTRDRGLIAPTVKKAVNEAPT